MSDSDRRKSTSIFSKVKHLRRESSRSIRSFSGTSPRNRRTSSLRDLGRNIQSLLSKDDRRLWNMAQVDPKELDISQILILTSVREFITSSRTRLGELANHCPTPLLDEIQEEESVQMEEEYIESLRDIEKELNYSFSESLNASFKALKDGFLDTGFGKEHAIPLPYESDRLLLAVLSEDDSESSNTTSTGSFEEKKELNAVPGLATFIKQASSSILGHNEDIQKEKDQVYKRTSPIAELLDYMEFPGNHWILILFRINQELDESIESDGQRIRAILSILKADDTKQECKCKQDELVDTECIWFVNKALRLYGIYDCILEWLAMDEEILQDQVMNLVLRLDHPDILKPCRGINHLDELSPLLENSLLDIVITYILQTGIHIYENSMLSLINYLVFYSSSNEFIGDSFIFKQAIRYPELIPQFVKLMSHFEDKENKVVMIYCTLIVENHGNCIKVTDLPDWWDYALPILDSPKQFDINNELEYMCLKVQAGSISMLLYHSLHEYSRKSVRQVFHKLINNLKYSQSQNMVLLSFIFRISNLKPVHFLSLDEVFFKNIFDVCQCLYNHVICQDRKNSYVLHIDGKLNFLDEPFVDSLLHLLERWKNQHFFSAVNELSDSKNSKRLNKLDTKLELYTNMFKNVKEYIYMIQSDSPDIDNDLVESLAGFRTNIKANRGKNITKLAQKLNTKTTTYRTLLLGFKEKYQDLRVNKHG